MKIFAKIRFYLSTGMIALIVALLMIPMVFLFPNKKGEVIHKLNRFMFFLLGGKLEISGERDKDANLFIMNHQSVIDIISLEAVENTHFSWIAKRELFEAPWFGRLFKYGEMISVDRDSKAGLIKLLKDVKTSINDKHRAVAIFPEGTRARGQKLLPFKAGANLVAKKLKLRVQPIVITGSKQLLDQHDHTAHSSTVKLTYLPAFDAVDAPKEWYAQIKTDMQNVIDGELEKYSRER